MFGDRSVIPVDVDMGAVGSDAVVDVNWNVCASVLPVGSGVVVNVEVGHM